MRHTYLLFLLCPLLLALNPLGAVEYVESPPLTEVIDVEPQPWAGDGAPIRVPLIAWGGDMQTVLANGNDKTTQSGSIFAERGLELELFREDVFAKQIEAYLRRDTPFLRGTMGMINLASEVTSQSPGTEMVVIYQLTWSAGGDALVVKDTIRRPQDLKGKTIAVQPTFLR